MEIDRSDDLEKDDVEACRRTPTEDLDQNAQPALGVTIPPSATPFNDVPYDDPFDFPVWRKWLITILLANTTLTTAFSSSVLVF
jgi:hypothetical protein